jgi:uncharacterized membrane protein required for colicin V production
MPTLTGLDDPVLLRMHHNNACTLLSGGSGMTIYDAAMAIVVVLGMIRGAWRGFIWQVASIASLILGYTAAHSGSARFASYLPGEPEVQRVLAMAVVYIAVSGGIFGLAWMVRGTLRKLKFEAYDRHLGTILGGIEGVGVGMLVTMFLVSVAPTMRQPIFSSPTGRVVGTVMNNLGPVLPAEVRKVLAPHWDDSSSNSSEVAGRDSLRGLGSPGNRPDSSANVTEPAMLPAIDEVATASEASGSNSTSHGLPALEIPPGNDPAVERASVDGPKENNSPGDHAFKQKAQRRAKARPSDGEHRIEHAIEETISSGKKQIEQAIDDSFDDQLSRLGGLQSAPQKGPK